MANLGSLIVILIVARCFFYLLLVFHGGFVRLFLVCDFIIYGHFQTLDDFFASKSFLQCLCAQLISFRFLHPKKSLYRFARDDEMC